MEIVESSDRLIIIFLTIGIGLALIAIVSIIVSSKKKILILQTKDKLIPYFLVALNNKQEMYKR